MDKVVKKRGRKSITEYYKTKKIDNVDIEDVITIHLPITIDDYNRNKNIERHMEILGKMPVPLQPYSPENEKYCSIQKETIVTVEPVKSEPIYVNVSNKEKTEIYDLTLVNNTGDNVKFKTNIACWWCCHKFENYCLSIPLKLRRDTYTVNGIFCSYPCCYSYMKSIPKLSKEIYLLNYLFRDSTGKKGVILDHINPAPPRESLKLFGGNLSIEEFRENSSIMTINNNVTIYKKSNLQKVTKIQEPQKIARVLPPSKIHTNTKVNIPNNSLGKILGIKCEKK